MNILIIGNGFDLAHGFPTKYTDFLRYSRAYNTSEPVSELNDMNEEFISFVGDNIWLMHFLGTTSDLDNPRTWIDFEKEVAGVIHNIEQAKPAVELAQYFNAPSEITLEFLSNDVSEELNQFLLQFSSYDKEIGKYVLVCKGIADTKDFIDFLYYQLRDFARAFEIYCLLINAISLNEAIITTERKREMEKKKEK